MNAQKAAYFLQDLASYKEGTLDEAAMVENLKWFLNDEEGRIQISEEEYQEILAQYENFEAILAYYEKVAKDLVKGVSTSEE